MGRARVVLLRGHGEDEGDVLPLPDNSRLTVPAPPPYAAERPMNPAADFGTFSLPTARWGDLETFEVIYRGISQGMTIEQTGRASDRSFASARTLYRRLARLERALHTDLVYRKRWSRETRITPHGELLHQHLEHVMQLKRELEERLRSAQPTLRVVTAGGIAIQALSHVWAQHPEHTERVAVEFIEQNMWRDAAECVRAGKADVGIFNMPAESWPLREVRAEKLTPSVHWPLLVHPQHRFAQRRRGETLQPVRIGELASETVTVQSVYAERFQPGVRARHLIRIPQFGQARPLVQKGVAVAPWCVQAERLYPTDGAVVVPLISSLCCTSVLAFAPQFPLNPSPHVAALLSDIRCVFRTLVPHGHEHQSVR